MTVCNMSIEAGARAGHDRARRDHLRLPQGPRVAPKGADWDAAVARWRSCRATTGAVSTNLARDRRRAARADDHLRHQPGHGHGRSTTPVPDPSAIGRTASAPPVREGAGLHGPRARQAAARPARSTWCSSAAAPTRACPTCASRGERSSRAARSPRACACWSCRAARHQEAGRGRGLDRIFKEAGAEWREPGCSMCIAMNGDQIEPKAVRRQHEQPQLRRTAGQGRAHLLASPVNRSSNGRYRRAALTSTS
jgi:3-isopropylmalate/(R)-2-methylmalate dehydratase large subunit